VLELDLLADKVCVRACDFCLTPNEQLFPSHITTRTSYIWWTRPTRAGRLL